MIVFSLADADRYMGMHPRFSPALRWLRNQDLLHLPAGSVTIAEGVTANVSDEPGRGRKVARLESHAQHIDLQIVAMGKDDIGLRPTRECKKSATDLDPVKDVQFWFDEPQLWLPLTPGNVLVLYPEDAHATMAGLGDMRKIVIKVDL